jgi:peptidoglycan hydrolase CwlO-like protein
LRATRRHARPARALLVLAAATSGLGLGPTAPPAQALPTQEEPTLPHASGLAADVDVFKADDGDVVGALDTLHGNLRTELRDLESARSQLASAQDGKAKADQAVAATQRSIDDLTAQSDGVVVDAFMNPPADTALDAMGAATAGDASVKASIVGMQHDADASILARLHGAHEELDAHKAAQADAARRAAAAADKAAAALEDLEAARSQEAAFVLEVQARLDRNLAEAEALAAIDPALAAQLKAQESEIAGRLETIRTANEQRRALEGLRRAQAIAAERQAGEERAAAEAADRAGSLGPATGSLSNVACPGGGSITVDSSLAANLSALLGAASAAGLNMCGGGYRDPAEQVALRRSHCGSSNYAIYQAPSSACSPPTARPGTSMHERGLAIDFTCGGGTVGRGSACFGWLASHAAGYGLHNLPSEPWHWSADGS